MPRFLNLIDMDTKQKKVKGSAVYLEDGGLIFTPYNSAPQNSPWKKVIASNYGRLKVSNEVVQMIITVPKGQSASKTFMREFSELMVKLNTII